MQDSLALLTDQTWRLSHLYKIANKAGESIIFKPNAIQSQVYKSLHTRNLILKARQLGMTTGAVLYLLDKAAFTPNYSAGIVSYSLEHAQHILRRIIGHAIDNLPPSIRSLIGIVRRSEREITFANGSFIRVDTSLRGGSYQAILVSEFGKTCARNPLKAEEIISGSLQSVPSNGLVIIESTGEGTSGFFCDMVQQAVLRNGPPTSPLDYKLHFFPWYLDPSYSLAQEPDHSIELNDYLSKLQKDQKLKLTQGQKNWYIYQALTLGDLVKREYPSSVSEAFLSSSDAYYFAQDIDLARQESRVLHSSPYDPLSPVYASADIGVNDLSVFIIFQIIHGEIRILDSIADRNKGVEHYARELLQRRYIYKALYLPHDAAHRDNIIVENTYQREFRKLMPLDCSVTVLPRTDKQILIQTAKNVLRRCVFDGTRCRMLLDHLSKYRKKWSESYGRYEDTPFHDESSNFGDAFQYMAQACSSIDLIKGKQDLYTKHKELVANRRNII